MKKIIIMSTFLLFMFSDLLASTFDDLKENRKTSYLDFILLKIEQRLTQRHSLLGAQPMALRIQYQSVGSQVEFIEEDLKILISVVGVMDKKRYKKKKYKPKISDCNILRNILLYGKYGYNMIFQKRNKYLTNNDMENIFVSRFLSNLSISDKEKEFIVNNTFASIKIIDSIRGNDIFCYGKIASDLN